jgi:hypothetical protein
MKGMKNSPHLSGMENIHFLDVGEKFMDVQAIVVQVCTRFV